MNKILKAGISTIQDSEGRFGYRRFGMPLSGAMDRQAAWWSNYLVGNRPGNPVIETSYAGLSIEFSNSNYIAVAGAATEFELNNQKVEASCNHAVQSGDVLRILPSHAGTLSYLAIRGQWLVDQDFQSVSTYLPSKIGGFSGRLLRKGDKINIETAGQPPALTIPVNYKRYIPSSCKIRFIPGPEFALLNSFCKESLLQEAFKISQDSSRTGYKLVGRALDCDEPVDFTSRPTVRGVIQLPPGGSPIILMADAPTTGGYPRLGKIVETDIDLLAQMRPGDSVRFQKVTNKEAEILFEEYRKIYEYVVKNV